MPLPHIDAALAQQVEHIHGKDGVSGPNPEGGSTLKQVIARVLSPCYFLWQKIGQTEWAVIPKITFPSHNFPALLCDFS